MILILSDKHDSHVDYLVQYLKDEYYFRLNLDVESLKKTYALFEGNYWEIEFDGRKFTTSEVCCVWARRTFVELLIEEEYDQSIDFKLWKNEWNRTLIGIYYYLRAATWMNSINKAYQAENKYLQADIAKKLGFKVPSFITTNIKTKILDFANREKDIVLKIMEQSFYKSPSGEIKGLYVNKITKNEIEKNFHSISENPVFIQTYIEKDYEVRYTVVDKSHFVCKIDSQKSASTKVDWRRYNIPQTPHYIMEPPEKIRAMVNAMMIQLEIVYGAFDFIVDVKGEWYFLEVNSMGQYLWIEDLTGLPITKTIAEWLITRKNIN